jgi:hemerythrin-like domain-containing protein
MTVKTELPDLFGRATIVMGGHEGLRETVRVLRGMSAALCQRAPVSLDELKARIATFTEQLVAHFAAEEGPDYFGALAAQSVPLSQGIRRLRSEHRQMTALVESLRAVGDLESNGVWFGYELEDLLDLLAEHEGREHQLLGEFFASDDA